jgi:hypothetical protein
VAVARDGDQVHIRDSKDAGGPVLTFDRAVFDAFIADVRETGPTAE